MPFLRLRPHVVGVGKKILPLALGHQLTLQRRQLLIVASLTAHRRAQVTGCENTEDARVLPVLIKEGDLPFYHRPEIDLLDCLQITRACRLSHSNDVLAHYGKGLLCAAAVLLQPGVLVGENTMGIALFLLIQPGKHAEFEG
ncbi:hypothetical protein D3C81_1443960 [compost metagenome]